MACWPSHIRARTAPASLLQLQSWQPSLGACRLGQCESEIRCVVCWVLLVPWYCVLQARVRDVVAQAAASTACLRPSEVSVMRLLYVSHAGKAGLHIGT